MKRILNMLLMSLCVLLLGVGCATTNVSVEAPQIPPFEPDPVETPDSGVESTTEENTQNATQTEVTVETTETTVEVETVVMPIHFSLAVNNQTQDELDAAATISKIVIQGIKNASVRYDENGHVYFDLLIAYNNMSGKPITISEMVSRVIFLDDTATKNELLTYAYSDFCDIVKPGCQLRDFYKRYDCGFYVPKESKARLSQIFKAGENEEYMTFDFGQLTDKKLDAIAQERLKADGYSKDTQLMVMNEPMERLLYIYNNMNGTGKNSGKFVLLGEGVANYNGPKGTVIIGKVFLAAVLDRNPINYIFTIDNP